jgi:hypothetical protein
MSSDPDIVLKLGRDLADALDPSDVVGRWMSHYLAELLTRCEESPHDEELIATTRDTVLKLWEHKSGASFQTKPFTYLQPVMRAIARLDPDPAPWAFYSPFDEEAPSAKALSTYPLLKMACDIDREVGRLIRLSVGITAQQAISCEETWVIAGKETAKTEEDRAVRALEQVIRRMRLQTEPDPQDAPKAVNEVDDQCDRASVPRPAAYEQLTEEPVNAGAQGGDSEDSLEPVDPLTLALQAAIIRCRHVLDQLADRYDVPAIDSEGTTTKSVAREERA